jgi:hypothetical protein
MSQQRNARRPLLVCMTLALLINAVPSSVTAADAVLYRIFLHDGSTVVSYGDFARVGGRVVFSIPITGLETATPALQLVSLAESAVDWDRTERYAETVRAKHYADTRGEAEFGQLSQQVADTLHAVAFAADPARRLALAEAAYTTLAEWPAKNHGYRAKDVAQLSMLLDQVVSDLRVAAGLSRFELSLVAPPSVSAAVPVLPAPELPERAQQALMVAHLTPESTERLSLLHAIVDALQPVRQETWATGLHARASADLSAELQTEKAYADLSVRALATADKKARRVDIKGLETLVRHVLVADDRLGRRRPQEMGALLATLDVRLEDARRLRLARDAWLARKDSLGRYERRIRDTLNQFRRAAASLEAIRRLDGPPPDALGRLIARASAGSRDLALVIPPSGTEAVHAMLTNAFHMAVRASTARQTAIHTTSIQMARHASSAAAGALLMFERAVSELQRLAAPPQQ